MIENLDFINMIIFDDESWVYEYNFIIEYKPMNKEEDIIKI